MAILGVVSWQTHGTIVDSRTIDRFIERGRTFDEAQRIYLIGAIINGRIKRLHTLSLSYEGIIETELQDARNQEALFILLVCSDIKCAFEVLVIGLGSMEAILPSTRLLSFSQCRRVV